MHKVHYYIILYYYSCIISLYTDQITPCYDHVNVNYYILTNCTLFNYIIIPAGWIYMLVCSIQYLFPISIVLFVMYSQNKSRQQ